LRRILWKQSRSGPKADVDPDEKKGETDRRKRKVIEAWKKKAKGSKYLKKNLLKKDSPRKRSKGKPDCQEQYQYQTRGKNEALPKRKTKPKLLSDPLLEREAAPKYGGGKVKRMKEHQSLLTKVV